MSHKVLVVDDSGVMRKIITVALNSCQVTDVLEAGDGKQAWEIFQKHKFDLIVSDWKCRTMTGIELLRTVRGSGSTIPFLLVTHGSRKITRA